uniref:WRKY transcription factor 33 n=1 Tax=Tetraselmis sp. GSL018 TaxID=582737 RepID=A0A061REW8_9CHLO
MLTPATDSQSPGSLGEPKQSDVELAAVGTANNQGSGLNFGHDICVSDSVFPDKKSDTTNPIDKESQSLVEDSNSLSASAPEGRVPLDMPPLAVAAVIPAAGVAHPADSVGPPTSQAEPRTPVKSFHDFKNTAVVESKNLMPPPTSPFWDKQNKSQEPAGAGISKHPPLAPCSKQNSSSSCFLSNGRPQQISSSLSITPALGPGPNQTLLDSPVLLPIMTAEPSPTTGIPLPIPLFQNNTSSKVRGFEPADRMAWRAPSGLGLDKMPPKAEAASRLPPISPSRDVSQSRAADDGYHWRKYGEKLVKGSAYPRSYFKCSFPGCPVKKIVERARDSGDVKETLYKGQHIHDPPIHGRAPRAGMSSQARGRGVSEPTATVHAKQVANVANAMEEFANGKARSQSSPGKSEAGVPLPMDAVPSMQKSSSSPQPELGPLSQVEGAKNTFEGSGLESNRDVAAVAQAAIIAASKMRTARTEDPNQKKSPDGSVNLESTHLVLDDNHMDGIQGKRQQAAAPEELSHSKRRKPSIGHSEEGRGPPPDDDDASGPPESPSAVPARLAEMQNTVVGPGQKEPRLVMLLDMDHDILEDGYRWRKYGQKLVRGNKFPRSYYKCTHSNCGVRKHIERSGQDSRYIIATYEGIHNHKLPPSGSVPASKRSSSRRSGEGPSTRRQQSAAVSAALAAKPEVKSEELQGVPAQSSLPVAASPVTPKAQKVTTSATLPIMRLPDFDSGLLSDDRPGSAFRALDGAASPSTSNLDYVMGKSSEKHTRLAPFGSLSSGMDTPNSLVWDPAAFFINPKSPGNIALPTPPSSITPPAGLELPSSTSLPSPQATT